MTLVVINGPWCPVCGSRDVRFERELRPCAWSSKGVSYEYQQVGYCNKCDPPDRFDRAVRRIIEGSFTEVRP